MVPRLTGFNRKNHIIIRIHSQKFDPGHVQIVLEISLSKTDVQIEFWPKNVAKTSAWLITGGKLPEPDCTFTNEIVALVLFYFILAGNSLSSTLS